MKYPQIPGSPEANRTMPHTQFPKSVTATSNNIQQHPTTLDVPQPVPTTKPTQNNNHNPNPPTTIQWPTPACNNEKPAVAPKMPKRPRTKQ
jgi:hypothetical protein